MAVEFTPEPKPTLFVGKGTAPQTAKVRLVCVATGDVHEAWPIDAREHVKAGDFVYEADYPAFIEAAASSAEALAAEAAAKAAFEAEEAAKAAAEKAAAKAKAEAEAEADEKAKADAPSTKKPK